jgi:hypothetical protein
MLNDTNSSATTAIGLSVKICMVASPGIVAGAGTGGVGAGGGGSVGGGPHPPEHTQAVSVTF